jgi:hypothetical protein
MSFEDSDNSAAPRSKSGGFRFSLLALLVFVTIFCLLLAWWQFVYLERQQLLARRDVLVRKIEKYSEEIQDKWEAYMDIGREAGVDTSRGSVLLDLDLQRLRRIDEEVMRLESETAILDGNRDADRTALEKRIADLRKRQAELEQHIERRSERFTELELRQRDLEQLQRMVDEMKMQLQEVEVEIETRGL